ncbi:hypothetical protein AK830_g4085 [Neonectria ditissima]|uniref:Methyltransferase type 11 domain-containing protein n=1 Tax=Neonectria ditissima TaxID=78410 RepID=A0A0P7BP40_9HYPO|nr:hypothetical protein AK830_g4085 [Neonectria ditissima]
MAAVHILVIGATGEHKDPGCSRLVSSPQNPDYFPGPSGLEFCSAALKKSHQLTLYLRNPDNLPAAISSNENITVIKGTLEDEAEIGGENMPQPVTDAMKMIFPLLIANKFERAMVLGTCSFTAPQDKGGLKWKASVILVKIIGGSAFEEFQGLGRFVTSQDAKSLKWTLFRVPFLGNGAEAPVNATYTGSGTDVPRGAGYSQDTNRNLKQTLLNMADLDTTAAEAHFSATAARYEKMTGGATRAVARHLLTLPELAGLLTGAGAVLHDNACGTCIVSEEVLQRNPDVTIHATDVAQGMIQLTEAKLGKVSGAQVAIMPAEKLTFADATFTHSITNLGIPFFSDGPAAAREIYRTLRPGGFAVVTSWSHLGYIEDVIVPVQRVVRPDATPFRVPVPQKWFTADGVAQCLREDGGFEEMKVVSYRTWYGAPSKEELVELLISSWKAVFWGTWPEDDQRRFDEELIKQVGRVSQDITLQTGEPGVGVPLDSIIVICRK